MQNQRVYNISVHRKRRETGSGIRVHLYFFMFKHEQKELKLQKNKIYFYISGTEGVWEMTVQEACIPIWWVEAPRIISTFLESYDLSGKKVIPFCTSGSSGIGSSASNLHRLADQAEWLSGRRFGSSASRNDMIEWVNSLGLSIHAQ